MDDFALRERSVRDNTGNPANAGVRSAAFKFQERYRAGSGGRVEQLYYLENAWGLQRQRRRHYGGIRDLLYALGDGINTDHATLALNRRSYIYVPSFAPFNRHITSHTLHLLRQDEDSMHLRPYQVDEETRIEAINHAKRVIREQYQQVCAAAARAGWHDRGVRERYRHSVIEQMRFLLWLLEARAYKRYPLFRPDQVSRRDGERRQERDRRRAQIDERSSLVPTGRCRYDTLTRSYAARHVFLHRPRHPIQRSRVNLVRAVVDLWYVLYMRYWLRVWNDFGLSGNVDLAGWFDRQAADPQFRQSVDQKVERLSYAYEMADDLSRAREYRRCAGTPGGTGPDRTDEYLLPAHCGRMLDRTYHRVGTGFFGIYLPGTATRGPNFPEADPIMRRVERHIRDRRRNHPPLCESPPNRYLNYTPPDEGRHVRPMNDAIRDINHPYGPLFGAEVAGTYYFDEMSFRANI